MVSGLLAGLRVLDLTRFVAGSQTTAVMAALGADVIKIEVPPGGDPYRVQGTERVGDQSVLFMSLNSGKKSVALDFRSPLAAQALDLLLAFVGFPGRKRQTRKSCSPRSRLGFGASAVPIPCLRFDLGLRRCGARRLAGWLRPDPSGRKRGDERHRKPRVRSGQGGRARP